eukprot:355059-Chlamydomonas_euryale.AAC.1
MATAPPLARFVHVSRMPSPHAIWMGYRVQPAGCVCAVLLYCMARAGAGCGACICGVRRVQQGVAAHAAAECGACSWGIRACSWGVPRMQLGGAAHAAGGCRACSCAELAVPLHSQPCAHTHTSTYA